MSVWFKQIHQIKEKWSSSGFQVYTLTCKVHGLGYVVVLSSASGLMSQLLWVSYEQRFLQFKQYSQSMADTTTH